MEVSTHGSAKLRRLFNRACADYQLLQDGDRVLVAVSGGKDSMVLTRLLGERARLHKPRIEVAAVHVVMDNVPYATDQDYLRQYCEECGVQLHVVHTHFDPTTDRRKTPCFLCSWYRRKALFLYASEHGYTKVALGHHQDDILVTMLMNLTFEGSFSSMPPLLPMAHYPVSLIRPLCLVPEAMVRDEATLLGVRPQHKLCPYETTTRRTTMQGIYQQLEQMNPEARYSMWRALQGRSQSNEG